MKIGFTGHRDKMVYEHTLDYIAGKYPGATWVHGGAKGFDSQVENYAKSHGILTEVIRPDYETYPPREAPLERNKTIVDESEMLFACYDGRNRGGTAFTVNYARKAGKQITILYPRRG